MAIFLPEDFIARVQYQALTMAHGTKNTLHVSIKTVYWTQAMEPMDLQSQISVRLTQAQGWWSITTEVFWSANRSGSTVRMIPPNSILGSLNSMQAVRWILPGELRLRAVQPEQAMS